MKQLVFRGWIIGLSIILVCICTPETRACITIPAFHERDDRFLFRAGTRYLEKTVHTDLWNIDQETLTDLSFEFGYERIMFGCVGLELNLGISNAIESWANSILMYDPDSIELINLYGTQNLKFYLPLGQKAVVFTGAGFDLYYDTGDISYDRDKGIEYYKRNDPFVLGGHIQIGLEYLIYENPGDDDLYDWPVSLELKYNHFWLGYDEAHNRVISDISDIGDIFSGSPPSPVSGHMISVGLKWQF